MVKDGIRRRNFRVVNLDVSGTITGAPLKMNSQTDVWYVDQNVIRGVSGDGTTWDEAFTKVEEAVAAAGNYDVILIADGEYLPTATLAITQTGLKMIGSNTSGYNWGPCRIKSSTSGDDIMTINANGVEIAGISFQCHTNTKDGIRIATTTHTYRTHIHDCYFANNTSGGTEGEIGIEAGVVSFDAPNLHIERCGFYYMSTAGISVYATRTTITDCLFWVNDGIGIKFDSSGGSRGGNLASNNMIIGLAGNTGTGISINSTEPTPGTLLICNNIVTNCSVDITTTESIEGIVNNQTYADATSYKQVDTTPGG